MTQEELNSKFRMLQEVIRKQYMQEYVKCQSGPLADPMRGQGRILAILNRKDGLSTKELAHFMNIRISSLNELLAKLEKNEYIFREPAEKDKRILLIRLTEKGKSISPELQTVDVFKCLNDEEQIIFAGYMDKIIQSIQKELDSEKQID